VQITVHQPLGVAVTDLSLRELGPDEVFVIKGLLAQHGVAVFPGQDLDNPAFLAFLRLFGEPVFTTGETPVEGFPDLNVISNVGLTRTPRSTFHVDSSYLSRPPDYTALRAVEIPRQGGETMFTNQYRAYETLPADVAKDLEGRTITHVVTGLDLDEETPSSADHPVLRWHPIACRTSLYLSTPARCAAVSGLAPEEASTLVAFLYEHSTAAANTFRHAWSAGDMVMWDNRCVLHRADHSDVSGDRVMHRGMVVTG
jgi:taurine dioxygenase